jgi:tetratricopeptide (TPR) repeat protein
LEFFQPAFSCEIETITTVMMRLRSQRIPISLLAVIVLASANFARAQRGVPAGRVTGFTVFGDLDVRGEESEGSGKALTFDLLLYSRSGVLIDRQKVGGNGRYRFLNVPAGDYEIAIEFENLEVARTQIRLVGVPTDFQQNITLQWHAGAFANRTPKSGTLSAEDAYERPATNTKRFDSAKAALDNKDYAKAIELLRMITADDPQDFQAWSELGTAYLATKNLAEAEASYLHAVEVRPRFFLALINLGRVRQLQKNYEDSITNLEQALALRRNSAEANFLLGEAFLQIKKGSKAVGYLNEALRLDPQGMADAHLRLAALYHGAGLKDRAAAEYETFLKKRPYYKDRKKLEQYIAENKKR